MNLYVVSDGTVHAIKIVQTSPRTFEVAGHEQFPFEHRNSNLYVKYLRSAQQEFIVVCNFPADYRDFQIDSRVHLFDMTQDKHSLETFEVDLNWQAMHIEAITQSAARQQLRFQDVEQRQALDPEYRFNQFLSMGIPPGRKRYFQAQMSLASVSKSHLYLALFNKKLLRIDFKMSETQRLIEKHNFICAMDLAGISELESPTSVPFGIFATSTELIVLEKSKICIYDHQMQPKQVLAYAQANYQGFFPLHVHFNHTHDQAWVFANQADGSQTAQKISRHE